jgi:predicted metal-dependent peptidase
MTQALTTTELKLTRARVQLLLTQPFFAALCLRLKLIPAPVPTMATDGKAIYYSERFVDSLTPDELKGVLAHEVLHCALAHHCRRGTRKKRLWNVAADYAINPIVLKNGLALPTDALLKDEYDGLCAEEIYSRLLQESPGGNSGNTSSPQPSGNGGSGFSNQPGCTGGPATGQQPASNTGEADDDDLNQPREGGFGEVLDATDDDDKPAGEGERTRQANEWAIAAEQAMRVAKAQGHGAVDVERPIKDSRESTQNWRAILREFVAATAPADYRWSPPNRRFISLGLYLPSLHREGVGRIVIAVDTSGSIGDKELAQFAGEISSISDRAQPERIHVVYCDERVHGSQEFGPGEPVTLEPRGGGGTDFRPVFEWVENNGIDPVCLIYLTDLACRDYPASAPTYPVLWVTDSRRIAPFGETVKIIAD